MPATGTRYVLTHRRDVTQMSQMSIFKGYADFYDSHYASKDYAGESAWILSLAEECGGRKPRTLLDMGCGTGGHLVHFAEAGLEVTGFDVSESMIGQAEKKTGALRLQSPEGAPAGPRVVPGDLRSFREEKRYDVVVSMFAAMGYLTSSQDFLAGLKTARHHLERGGIFIFDVWSGPAVVHEKPETRVEERIDGGRQTIRVATPSLNVARQVVTVDYHILQLEKGTVIEEVRETHEMRFFFPQELTLALKMAGFECARISPFMEGERELTVNDWNISVVARAT